MAGYKVAAAIAILVLLIHLAVVGGAGSLREVLEPINRSIDCGSKETDLSEEAQSLTGRLEGRKTFPA